MTINADKFTPIDKTFITTGELRPVKGTPFDFRKPATIGSRITNQDDQLKFGLGYDHNWVINKPPGRFAAVAKAHESLHVGTSHADALASSLRWVSAALSRLIG